MTNNEHEANGVSSYLGEFVTSPALDRRTYSLGSRRRPTAALENYTRPHP